MLVGLGLGSALVAACGVIILRPMGPVIGFAGRKHGTVEPTLNAAEPTLNAANTAAWSAGGIAVCYREGLRVHRGAVVDNFSWTWSWPAYFVRALAV